VLRKGGYYYYYFIYFCYFTHHPILYVCVCVYWGLRLGTGLVPELVKSRVCVHFKKFLLTQGTLDRKDAV
jgi:hypothetical protein